MVRPPSGRWIAFACVALACLALLFLAGRKGGGTASVEAGGELPETSAGSGATSVPSLQIEGRVFVETGAPGTVPMPVRPASVGSCQVQAWAQGEPRSKVETCASGGAFTLEVEAATGEVIAVAIEVSGRLRAVLEAEVTVGVVGRLPDVALGVAETVSGQVVDGQGRPQAGVMLEAMPDPHLGEPEPWRVTTSAEGTFVFDTLPPGPVVIRASAPGFAPVLVEALAPQEDVWVRLEALIDLRGRVIGPPDVVAGARVRLEGSGVWPLREVAVNAEGTFVFPQVPEGVYALEAVVVDSEGPAFASLAVENVSPEQHVALALIPAQALHVEVLDPEGEPAVGARVSLANAQLGLLRRVETTDVQGVAVLRPLVPGRYVVRAEAEGSLPADGVEVAVDADIPEPVTLRLRAPGRIAGRVEDETGRGVGHAQVRLRSDALFILGESQARKALFRTAMAGRGMLGVTEGPVPPLPEFGAVSQDFDQSFAADSEGRFLIEGLHAGTYRLEAWHPDLATSDAVELTLASGEARTGVTLILRQGTLVVGQVLDTNRRPIQGAVAEADGERRSETDARGVFVLGSMRDALTLVVRAEGYAPHQQEVAVVAPRTEIEVVLQTADAVAEGRVASEQGQAIAGAWLRLQSRDRLSASVVAQTDTRGLWRIEGLPAGTFDIEVEHPDHATVETVATLGAGRVTTIDIVLGSGWELEVWVRSLGPSDPIEGAQVSVGGPSRRTDTLGRVVFENLRDPEVELRVAAEGHGVQHQIVQRPTGRDRAAVDVELRAGGRIEGSVTDYRGDPVAGALVRLRSDVQGEWKEQRTSVRGRWAFEGVPEGDVLIEATPPPERQEELADAALASDVLEGRVTRDVHVRFDRQ